MRRLAWMMVAGATLAACGTATAQVTGPVARAARALASVPLHFCFVIDATAQDAQERISGCGDESAGARRLALTQNLLEQVGSQRQQSSEGVIEIGSKEWVSSSKVWQLVTPTTNVIEPLAVADLVDAAPGFVVGRGSVVDGVQALAYSTVLEGSSLSRTLARLPAALAEQYRGENLRSDDLTVELSPQGRLLEVDQHQSLVVSGQAVTAVSVLVLSRFGQSVTVTPPSPVAG
ncbi:hypothetical protein Afer_0048 [Acidimicrobium ferrooxidans DSM 10331]|uniref:Lipoprotein n=2 Tax=Acidimicrobium ferrooxidans TaxID=53635 RepID=C7M1H4_ACIFD|nr:hypothetical protein Afer_0048 [Acidimicrobium ferrooxidans DSM 10331]